MSTLRNNTAESRYEMDEQGMTSWADYRLSGERLYIDLWSRRRRCAGPARQDG